MGREDLPDRPEATSSALSRLPLGTWGSTALLLALAPPSSAQEVLTGSPPASSYYVSLGLFVITIPGLWSLIKRAPRATVKRKVFQVDGPAVEGAMGPGARARQILEYFTRYNYEVKDMGEVITFEGNYRASAGERAWGESRFYVSE